MSSKKFTLIALVLMTLAYFLLDAFNRVLFSSPALTNGANWIYLPSGLRLAFVLVFLHLGALAIVLASCVIGLLHYSGMDTVTVLGAGFISGFSPWLARIICLDKFKIDSQMQHLSAAVLLKMAVSFAALNAVLQQLWFIWRDSGRNFVDATAVMFVADLFGTLIVLYLVKFSLSLLPEPGRIK